jgi:hypothetical protein
MTIYIATFQGMTTSLNYILYLFSGFVIYAKSHSNGSPIGGFCTLAFVICAIMYFDSFSHLNSNFLSL